MGLMYRIPSLLPICPFVQRLCDSLNEMMRWIKEAVLSVMDASGQRSEAPMSGP